jgi:O-antigen/teichoic acid export membrane protein
VLKHLTSAYAVGVMSRISGQIIAFATVMIASRFLNLAEFGTFALAWAAAVIANSFVFTGFYQALLRSPDPEADRDTFFWLIFGVGAFSTVVIGSVGLMAGGLATQAGLAFCALAPIPMLMSPVAWNEALLVSAKRVRSASSYIILSESFGLIVAYFCLKAGYGLFSLIAARYAMAIVSIVVTSALVRNWPQLRMIRKTVHGCKTTVPLLWGTTAMGMFSNYGTDIILGAFLNPVAVGAYRGGSRIAVTISDLVLQPMTMLSWSRFTRLEKENRPDLLSDAWVENMTLTAALVWPVLLAVALLSPELVSVVFDETWLPAAPVLTLLSLSRAARFFSTLLEPTMICSGKPGVPLKIRFIGVVLLLASLLTFGRFSVEAAATAHLSTSVVVGVMSIVATITVLNLSRRDLMVTFLPGLLLAGAFGAVILATSEMRIEMGPTAGLGATVGLLAVIWLVAMVLGIRRKILVFPKP